MKLKRILILFSVVIVMAFSATVGAGATEAPNDSTISISSSTDASIEPRIEVIEKKYRYTVDGRLQYRHWNATHGYWVEPDWIDIV